MTIKVLWKIIFNRICSMYNPSYPLDDSFWYHFRQSTTVALHGRRELMDYYSYYPEGRKSDTYPPILHYLYGYFIKFTRKFHIRDLCAVHILNILIFLFTGFLPYILLKNPIQALFCAILIYTTPIIIIRMGKMSLRGDIMIGAMMIISIWLCCFPISHLTLLLLPIIYLVMMLTTKTSLIFIEGSLFVFTVFILFNQFRYGFYFIVVMVSFLTVKSYYKRKGTEFTLPIFRIRHIRKSQVFHRTRYPYVTEQYILTEEEKPPSFKEIFLLIPFLPLSLVAIFILPNTFLFFVVKVMVLFHFISLRHGRRYLIHLAVFSAILLAGFVNWHPFIFVISIVLNIIFLIIVGKNKQSSDVYDGVNWLKDNAPPDSIVIAWWKYGHILSGYGRFRNIWDSYFVNVDVFLKHEKLFDNIVERTIDGISFCNQYCVRYLLIETFRNDLISNQYELCYHNKSICIYRVS